MKPNERNFWITILWIYSVFFALGLGAQWLVVTTVTGSFLAGGILILLIRLAYIAGRRRGRNRQ